jgi:hypothetical protein
VHGFSFRIKKDCDLPFHIARTGVKQNPAIGTISSQRAKGSSTPELRRHPHPGDPAVHVVFASSGDLLNHEELRYGLSFSA